MGEKESPPAPHRGPLSRTRQHCDPLCCAWSALRRCGPGRALAGCLWGCVARACDTRVMMREPPPRKSGEAHGAPNLARIYRRVKHNTSCSTQGPIARHSSHLNCLSLHMTQQQPPETIVICLPRTTHGPELIGLCVLHKRDAMPDTRQSSAFFRWSVRPRGVSRTVRPVCVSAACAGFCGQRGHTAT